MGGAATQPLSTPTCAVFEQHSGTGSSSHQTSSERQAGLPRIPGGSANDSRLRSNPHDPEGASFDGWQEMIFFDRFTSSTAFSIWQPKNARQTLGDKLVCI